MPTKKNRGGTPETSSTQRGSESNRGPQTYDGRANTKAGRVDEPALTKRDTEARVVRWLKTS